MLNRNWCLKIEISKKLEVTFVDRMPEDVKLKFLALSGEEREAIIKVLVRFQQIIEEETFQLLLGIINARFDKK
jgi:hypothetical protein